MTREELDDIQRLADRWRDGRYGDQGLRLKAEATARAINSLLEHLADLRARLEGATQESASWRRVAERLEGEKQAAEAACARLTAERDALKLMVSDLTQVIERYQSRPGGASREHI